MDLSRRVFSLLLCGAPVAFTFDAKAVVRGKLTKDPAGRPALQTTDGAFVIATGDEETTLVLNDKRLAGSDFEAIGEKNADAIEINPIHLAALWAYKDGKRRRVTYWCDVCAIRTYSPGLCWCCREDTELELRDPDTV
ncbi:MAG: hypothetical protein SGI92_03360 [Bryobacteraceae bacterium]|nr:hypothetical protein [Bryobacteraceae bacterium]